ncbi:hypothetical protein ACRQ5Q_22560 [Bradyrhizobium sp. PMVTL-01]|uniref:hypothetical protein n=1 Tax=Bradyrhizobium sp. PMVTL-01 TaxID=3434999 RepID=UPI003F723BCB
MISEGMARALERREEEQQPSEFGVTLADAGRLLRRAQHCWIIFEIAEGKTAIFGISKAAVRKEIKFYAGGHKTFRPSELDHSSPGSPTLIFGSKAANEHAKSAATEGMAT